ncbi:hypothetical protein [Dactylosporangium sp. NPDC048998]|uniref:SbtR family transcriptional regulator n=1 Tax=Dactylosporangium sp. NPDC048998 TaxID=3363976 RepID=UPI00371D3F05
MTRKSRTDARHNRELLDAVLAERVAACEADLRAALTDPDPWRGLSATVRHFAARQVDDRGLNEVLLPPGTAFAEQRRAHAGALERLVDRASHAGVARPGLSVQDVRAGLTALASLRALPPARAAATIGRLTELLLAGMAGRAAVEAR